LIVVNITVTMTIIKIVSIYRILIVNLVYTIISFSIRVFEIID